MTVLQIILYTYLKILLKNRRVTVIDIARNFSQHAALMAGLREASGDVIVCIDDDCQTPPSEVYNLIDRLTDFDVCYASYEDKKHSYFRNFGRKVNSKMLEIMLDKPRSLYISNYFAMHFQVHTHTTTK